MDPKLIGRMVAFHRKKAELSQEKLGFIAGLGKTVVFDVEKGKLSIRLESLLKILDVLNIQLDFQGPLMSLFKGSLNENS